MLVATLLLSECGPEGCQIKPPPFCAKHSLRSMLDDVIYANTPDKDTQAIRPDAQAIRDNLDNHAAGGGPSSPENVARFQRFRAFVKKKCLDKDIGKSVTDLSPDMHINGNGSSLYR
jgi:hypothetical protein